MNTVAANSPTAIHANEFSELRMTVPFGKLRVVGIDLADKGDYIVDDYDNQDEAFSAADSHNRHRNCNHDIYVVYKYGGEPVRGPADVGSPLPNGFFL